MDHNEFCCIFDASQYTGTPDGHPCPRVVDVPAAIRALDALYAEGREAEAEDFLEAKLRDAHAGGDWRAELSMLSELLGQYRRSMSAEKGLRTVNEALSLIREHQMGQTVSAATVMLNAATTLKCFHHAAESIPIFTHVARVYADNLDPSDYRFAGFYNNMALTWCNLAEMYARRDPEDPRVETCMEKAWECLNDPALPHDGYHAFTISKCAPTFDYFGYFLYAKKLRERTEKIYAGS